jgi:hypothetical protein
MILLLGAIFDNLCVPEMPKQVNRGVAIDRPEIEPTARGSSYKLALKQ